MKGGDMAHFMFEAKSLDDVGRAYDIVHAEGFPIAMTLGRHTNDNTTSFYLYSPSGWWVEYGCGGLPPSHQDPLSTTKYGNQSSIIRPRSGDTTWCLRRRD